MARGGGDTLTIAMMFFVFSRKAFDDSDFNKDGFLDKEELRTFWAIYNDLSRGHPKWWFSKGIPPKMALN